MAKQVQARFSVSTAQEAPLCGTCVALLAASGPSTAVLANHLRGLGADVQPASPDGRWSDHENADVILLEWPLEDDAGGTIRAVRAALPHVPVLLTSWRPELELAYKAGQAAADGYVPLPLLGAVLPRHCHRQGQPPAGWLPSLAWVERAYLEAVLTMCGGRKAAAARALGLHRSALQRKLKESPPTK